MSYKYIVIGGSAGSFQIVTGILSALPKTFNLPIFLCLHRLKHIRTGFVEALSIKSKINVVEPCDKEFIRQGKAYLAPANYHMYFDLGNFVSLSTEPAVNHSRPSIDISFASAAFTYKSKLVGILLSGANRDGAMGMKEIKENGGLTIVQDPNDCQVKTMTTAALEATNIDHVLTSDKIIDFIVNLNRTK
ncbi:MAG: chemotaxis protein CheB [Bacteroidetes bacterium 4572_117]|nr:MAG: chemotaxis protein CheB [Bacteroidetes bacterium 4572_117]